MQTAMKLILSGYIMIAIGSFCVAYFASTEHLQFLALGGLVGAITGGLMVARGIDDDYSC